MDLSIVLCTWNNARRLAVTLGAISRCRIPPTLQWELVLVANNCTDATADVARGFGGRLPLHHVAEPRQGLSHARNTGVATARGRLIVFADDDITPCVEWITAYWLAHRERPAGYYFGGPLTCEYETGPPEPSACGTMASCRGAFRRRGRALRACVQVAPGVHGSQLGGLGPLQRPALRDVDAVFAASAVPPAVLRGQRHASAASRGERIEAPLAFCCGGYSLACSAARRTATMLPGASVAARSRASASVRSSTMRSWGGGGGRRGRGRGGRAPSRGGRPR